ncbi:hypothetical protein PIB30_067163 [Stylosanthes scabra]|uniref:Uncharacterized protein n=1 Tax=Stylosanthes scabra TaxID=79078 RepID=A0ABU6RMJ4_9FABA|nr:hypothetical protein [Stylosanthes scabra]
MARTKQTGRRTAREIPPPLPCLSNYVEEDWFEEDSEKKAYYERLSRMHVIPPRYVGDGAIPEDKYPEFWTFLSAGIIRVLLQWPSPPLSLMIISTTRDWVPSSSASRSWADIQVPYCSYCRRVGFKERGHYIPRR